MDKKSIVNDLYHASLISVLAVGYLMLGKKILRMAPPNIQKFDLEDTGKLVVIVAASEMTREYLNKQKKARTLLLSLVVVICAIDYQRTVLMPRERDMMQQ